MGPTHFVVDTSRNGDGQNNVQKYASARYDQPGSVIGTLASGSWCNPLGSGLGLRPTASTGVALLDAYLWVATPGQSDGQCDPVGGVRAWNYSDYARLADLGPGPVRPAVGHRRPRRGPLVQPASSPARLARHPGPPRSPPRPRR